MKRIKIEDLKPLNSNMRDLNEKQVQKINGGQAATRLPYCPDPEPGPPPETPVW